MTLQSALSQANVLIQLGQPIKLFRENGEWWVKESDVKVYNGERK